MNIINTTATRDAIRNYLESDHNFLVTLFDEMLEDGIPDVIGMKYYPMDALDEFLEKFKTPTEILKFMKNECHDEDADLEYDEYAPFDIKKPFFRVTPDGGLASANTKHYEQCLYGYVYEAILNDLYDRVDELNSLNGHHKLVRLIKSM